MKTTIIIGLIAITSCLTAQEVNNKDDNLVILHEYFNEVSADWYFGEAENYTIALKDGKYHVESKASNGIYIASNMDILGAYENFMFESKIKQELGKSSDAFGMIYGYRDSRTYFSFDIGETGFFRILKIDEGESSPLVDWTTTDAIRPDSFNTLSVYKIGNALYYGINNILVSKLKYTGYYGLKLGFIAYNQQAIAIDELLVRKLTAQEAFNITEKFVQVDKNSLYSVDDDDFTKRFKEAFAQTFNEANQRFKHSISEVKTEYQFDFITKKYSNLANLFPLAEYALINEDVYETIGEIKYKGAQEASIFFDCREKEADALWNDAIFDDRYSKIYKALIACKNAKIGGEWEVVYQDPNTSGAYHRKNFSIMPILFIMQSKKLPGLSVYVGLEGQEGIYLNFIIP